MLQSTAIGMLGLFAVAMCWALAVVLYRVGESGSVARKLALLVRLRDSLGISESDAAAIEGELAHAS